MANFTYPLGKSTEAKRTDTAAGQAATPSVQQEIKKTGRQPGDGVGDTATPTTASTTQPTGSSHVSRTNAPSGTNKDLWAEAERAALNSGGFSGVDDKGRTALVQDQYDKMVESDKQTKQWAYGDDKTVKDGILGDIK